VDNGLSRLRAACRRKDLMGGLSIWHWIVVVVVVLLLFGRGKISELMGDAAKGIKAFKRGMSEDETAEAKPVDPKNLEHQPPATAQTAQPEKKVG
jgi:sec-independent protein translocase protein TatA